MVSVIGVGGVETTMVIEGAVDTLVFHVFCEQCLRPYLQVGLVASLVDVTLLRNSPVSP
jgi:hypothetical protein